MPYDYNKSLVNKSQQLRREMTPEERHLWYDFLKLLPVTVNRQKIINNFIVDFYIHSAKIVIEIDGIQHKTKEGKLADAKRDKALSDAGFTVLRYSNEIVNEQFGYVCGDILQHLGLTFSDIKERADF